MADPKPAPASCSEVVERLPMSAREFRQKHCVLPSSLDTYPKAEEFAEAYAEAILHSWRERRVQELEDLIAKRSGCPHCNDSASGSTSSHAAKEIR